MGDEFVNQIWTPDTFIINAVETQVHKLTKENQKIFMNLTNGYTMHASRYAIIPRNTVNKDIVVQLSDFAQQLFYNLICIDDTAKNGQRFAITGLNNVFLQGQILEKM